MISATIETDDGLPLTLPGLLRQQAAQHGDRAMLVCDDERLTYTDAETRSRVLARGLLAAGIGTMTATMLPYTLAFLLSWSLLLVTWVLLGWPVGPGAPLFLSIP